MRIREVAQRAENLIEQGRYAQERASYYEQAVDDARGKLIAAHAMLESASRSDEQGNAAGDVVRAQTEVYAAQVRLEAAQRGLNQAQTELQRVNGKKQETVLEVDRYSDGESANLSKLQTLQHGRFGGNAAAFAADLAARMNAGEDAKAKLLHSMGQSASPRRFSAGGGAGAAHTAGIARAAGAAGRETVAAMHNGPTAAYGYFGAELPQDQAAAYEFGRRFNAIYNDPSLTRQQRQEQLVQLREHMRVGAQQPPDDDAQPVLMRKLSGNTGISTRQQRRERLQYECYDDISRTLSDASLSAGEKRKRLQEIRDRYAEDMARDCVAEGQYGGKLDSAVRSLLAVLLGDSVVYRGTAEGKAAITAPSIQLIAADARYSPENTQLIRNHPRFAGSAVFEGIEANVFGLDKSRRGRLVYSQGNNPLGWQNSCSIAQASNGLNCAGIPTSEARLTAVCHKNGWGTDSDGALPPYQIAALISGEGMDCHYYYDMPAEEVACAVENGHMVIVGVNSFSLYRGAYDLENKLSADHAIFVTNTLRAKSTNDLMGFVINNTARRLPEDRARAISLSDFREAYDVPFRAAIVSDKQVL